MSEKVWRPFNDECPKCGDAAEVYTDSGEDNLAYDGDEARCQECHHPGSITVYEFDLETESGEAGVRWQE